MALFLFIASAAGTASAQSTAPQRSWSEKTPLPVPRDEFAVAAAIGRVAYFTAGSLGCGGGPQTEQLLVFSLP